MATDELERWDEENRRFPLAADLAAAQKLNSELAEALRAMVEQYVDQDAHDIAEFNPECAACMAKAVLAKVPA